jgi:hypothetical protein
MRNPAGLNEEWPADVTKWNPIEFLCNSTGLLIKYWNLIGFARNHTGLLEKIFM